MAGKNLFGTLQTPLKPIHYTGIDTETIDVIVNSENRTISANLQPKVTEVIANNIAALRSAYEKLTELNNEIDKVEQVIANIYSSLSNNLTNLKDDTKQLSNEITRIQTEYATQVDVKTWIDEARIPQAELNTYAKVADVEKEISRLEADITEINNSLDATNLRLDTFEASIGPLPTDKTLKEEIFDTFATKEELDIVQNKAGSNLVLIMALDSELMDTNKAIEDINNSLNDYATKDYVADEISKIDIGGGTGGDVDLENYYTKSQTESKIEDALNSITLITASIDSI